MSRSQTVFVVDDDHSVRESIRELVGSVRLPVETFANAQEFLGALNGGRPGCVVLDLRMPGMSGLDLQQHLIAKSIAMPVIMVSGYGDVASVVHAMKAGAMDFIEKPFSRQLLLDRIHRALETDEKNCVAQARRAELAARCARLTPREAEVMDHVVAGKTNKAIAAELGLCEKTVEVHRAHMMGKMRVQSLAELVRVSILLQSS
jgi:FixJ family two-component response regulator